MNVHDEHYRKIEGRGVEPIEVQETIICNDIPPELHAIVKRNFNLAQASKYMMRCGEKDQPEKELAKAQNYIHRAIHGCWNWQSDRKKGGELPANKIVIVGESTAPEIPALPKERITEFPPSQDGQMQKLPQPTMAKGSWALDTTTIPE